MNKLLLAGLSLALASSAGAVLAAGSTFQPYADSTGGSSQARGELAGHDATRTRTAGAGSKMGALSSAPSSNDARAHRPG